VIFGREVLAGVPACARAWNVAVKVSSALIEIWQMPVPEQPPPDQPANVEPDAAAAVSVTCCPELNSAVQVAPQSIPDGELVTVPDPDRAVDTVRTSAAGVLGGMSSATNASSLPASDVCRTPAVVGSRSTGRDP
jgi:hypothetical protein